MSHSTARGKERPYTSPLPKGEEQEGKMPGWYCDDLVVVSPGAVLLGKVQWKAFRKKCCQSNFCWKCYFDTSGHIVLIIAFSKVTSSLQCSALMIFQTKLQSFSLRVNFSSTFYLTWENRERKKTFDWPRLPAGRAGFAKTFQILLPFPRLEGNPQASHLLERGGPTLQGTWHFSWKASSALERWPKWGKQHILAGNQKSEQPWQVSFVQGKQSLVSFGGGKHSEVTGRRDWPALDLAPKAGALFSLPMPTGDHLPVPRTLREPSPNPFHVIHRYTTQR